MTTSTVQNLSSIESQSKDLQEFGPRPLGSENLIKAISWTQAQFQLLGYEILKYTYSFPCWKLKKKELSINGTQIDAVVNNFSPSCHIQANFEIFLSIESLEDAILLNKALLQKKILVLGGSLSKESIFPKDYPFYFPPEHQRIYTTLEDLQPPAIIFLSHNQNRPLYPIIEDETFSIPSMTLSIKAGLYFFNHREEQIKVMIETESHPQTMEIITAVKHGTQIKKNNTKKGLKPPAMITAHLDSQFFSLGAHDDASGVLCLLELAHLCAQKELPFDIYFTILTDHEHSGKGEFDFFTNFAKWIPSLKLFVNLDAIGHKIILDKLSFYNISDEIKQTILKPTNDTENLFKQTGIREGDQWIQGEHSYFAQIGIPCIAISCGVSEDFHHSVDDTFEALDYDRLKLTAQLLKSILISYENAV